MWSTEVFFYLQKGKAYYSTQLTMNCPALPRLSFYDNLLISQETSVYCLHFKTGVHIKHIELSEYKGFPKGRGIFLNIIAGVMKFLKVF